MLGALSNLYRSVIPFRKVSREAEPKSRRPKNGRISPTFERVPTVSGRSLHNVSLKVGYVQDLLGVPHIGPEYRNIDRSTGDVCTPMRYAQLAKGLVRCLAVSQIRSGIRLRRSISFVTSFSRTRLSSPSHSCGIWSRLSSMIAAGKFTTRSSQG